MILIPGKKFSQFQWLAPIYPDFLGGLPDFLGGYPDFLGGYPDFLGGYPDFLGGTRPDLI